VKSTQRIQRTYYLITSLFWLAIALPMALIILLGQARGLDLFQVGLLMGIYSLTIVLLEVPTGGLADAIGRKPVAVLAYSFMTLSSIVFLFAFSFPVILAAFILSGVGRALSSGALDAWFVDELQAADPEAALQPALAKAGTFTLLALGIGALLGSLLPRFFSHLPADGTAVLTPFSIPIVFSIAIKIVLLALTFLLVKEDRHPSRASDWKTGFREVPGMVRTGLSLSRGNPTILLLLGATLASGLAVISLESFWQPKFAHLLGGGVSNSFLFGIVLGGSFLVGMLGNLLSTPLSRLLNERYGLVGAIFQGIWGLAIILLALQTTPLLAAGFFWLAYMSMGVINSPHNTLLNREIPAEQRSSMLSIASLVGYVGAMIGGAGLGYVAEHASISTAWIIGGMVLVVSLGLYWRVDIRQSQGHARLEKSVAEA
jgi:DHA1 family quinolone resistance protein-like MFS transporter